MPENRLSVRERHALVENNLGLVRKQAHKFKRQGVLNYEDLYSHGCDSLNYAARCWPGLGKFSTYATVCIKRHLIKTVNSHKLLPQSVPIHSGADEAGDGQLALAFDPSTENDERRRLAAEAVNVLLEKLPGLLKEPIKLRFGICCAAVEDELAAAFIGIRVSVYKQRLLDGLYQLRLLAVQQANLHPEPA